MLLFLACTGEPTPKTGDSVETTGPSVEPWTAVESDIASALQSQLDLAVLNHVLVGAAMGVACGGEERLWAGASGQASLEEGIDWSPERSFRIGSVTKTFTAAMVFLLEEEGLLHLDDGLEKWVPGYYDGNAVTLRHLMSNTSGIVSYNYVGSFDSNRPWTPTGLVDWAVLHEPNLRFEPGSQWEYSNTNWVLLGLVIEAAGGASYETQVSERLLDPWGLTDTYVAGTGDDNVDIVDCYDQDRVTNLTDSADPSFGWAAGAMVSTPSDLARWGAVLYGGEVLSDDALTQMTTPTVLTDGSPVEYGMGAFVETDGVDTLVGHTGGFAGYLTYMYHWEADNIVLVAMSNTLETDMRDLAAYGWSVPLGFDYPD